MADTTTIGTLAYAVVADTSNLKAGLAAGQTMFRKSARAIINDTKTAFTRLVQITKTAFDSVQKRAKAFANSKVGKRITGAARAGFNRAGGFAGIAQMAGQQLRAQMDRIVAAREVAKERGVSFGEIAREQGLGVTEAQAIEVEKAAKAMENVEKQFRDAVQQLAVVLSPAIVQLSRAVNHLADKLPGWWKWAQNKAGQAGAEASRVANRTGRNQAGRFADDIETARGASGAGQFLGPRPDAGQRAIEERLRSIDEKTLPTAGI